MVVGGGFAGLNAVHALRQVDADVVLVDRNNYHTFQPLLYQVSTGYLAAEEVGVALRSVFRRQRNVTVRMAAAVSVDWAERSLLLQPGGAVHFDYLVIAAGAKTNFFHTAGMAEHAWPLYTLRDATRLCAQLLTAFERVPREPGRPDTRITVVVVGGGPTGWRPPGRSPRWPKTWSARGASLQVTLVEAGPRLLSPFSPQSSRAALADLRRRGVDVRLAQAVERADVDGVTLAGGERIETGTVIWAAGVQANGLGGTLALDVARHGRVVVDQQLQVPGHPNVFVAGDLAAVTTTRGDQSLPMLATVAIQAGRHAGEQVARRIKGRPLTPFRYRNKGMLAVLGRGDAVAELPLQPGAGAGGRLPLRFGGLPAWLLWLGVHIVYLVGFRNRFKVLVDWGWSYFTSRGGGAILGDVSNEEPR